MRAQCAHASFACTAARYEARSLLHACYHNLWVVCSIRASKMQCNSTISSALTRSALTSGGKGRRGGVACAAYGRASIAVRAFAKGMRVRRLMGARARARAAHVCTCVCSGDAADMCVHKRTVIRSRKPSGRRELALPNRVNGRSVKAPGESG